MTHSSDNRLPLPHEERLFSSHTEWLVSRLNCCRFQLTPNRRICLNSIMKSCYSTTFKVKRWIPSHTLISFKPRSFLKSQVGLSGLLVRDTCNKVKTEFVYFPQRNSETWSFVALRQHFPRLKLWTWVVKPNMMNSEDWSYGRHLIPYFWVKRPMHIQTNLINATEFSWQCLSLFRDSFALQGIHMH